MELMISNFIRFSKESTGITSQRVSDPALTVSLRKSSKYLTSDMTLLKTSR